MITAAIHGVAVAPPRAEREPDRLSAIAAEIAERLAEMDEAREGSGADFVLRLATMARIDRGAYDLVVSALHGDTSQLTDSYAERGERAGRPKQTIHYRVRQHIEAIRAVFPSVADVLDATRSSVMHHEDPVSQLQVVRQTEGECV